MRRTKHAISVCCALSALIIGGCATIISGTTQTVTFNSVPDEATVTLNERVLGKTPITLPLKRKGKQTLIFEKDGFKPLSVPMTTTANGWFIGNVIFGGLIGTSTDISSGAVIKYAPDKYMVSLEPMEESRLGGRLFSPKSQQLTEFILSGHANILKDLSKGGGPYLESMLTLLEVSEDARGKTIEGLRELSEEFIDGLEFSEQVLARYA